MQDWQAYFSPSMIGMPLSNYGRLRSSHQAVGSRAVWQDSAREKVEDDAQHAARGRGRERENKKQTRGIAIQNPKGVSPNGKNSCRGWLDEDREHRKDAEEWRVESREGRGGRC